MDGIDRHTQVEAGDAVALGGTPPEMADVRVPPGVRRAVGSMLESPALLLGLLMLIMFAAALFAGRGTTFYSDDFDFISDRSGEGSLVDELLRPDQEYFVLVPALVYKALFATVGLSHYWVYRVVAALVHLVCVVLVWRLVRIRLDPKPGLLIVAPLVFLGKAGEDILWPYQIGVMGSVACGLGSFLAANRKTVPGDVAAAVLLTVAIACSPQGLPFVVAVTVLRAVETHLDLRRLWVPVPAIAVYSAWYFTYAESAFRAGNIVAAPAWGLDAFAGAVGAFTGVGIEWGRPLAVGLALLVVWRLSQEGAWPGRLMAYLTLGFSFWLLVPLGRPGEAPDTSRHLYLGGFAIALVITELAAGHQLRPRLHAIAAVFVAASCALGLAALYQWGNTYRTIAADTAPQLGALELSPVPPPRDYVVSDVFFIPPIRAEAYLGGVRRIGGTPAPSPDRLPYSGSAEARTKADRLLLDLGVLRLEPARGSDRTSPPEVRSVSGGTVAERGSCAHLTPGEEPGLAALELALPSSGLVVRADTAIVVKAKRFGTTFVDVKRLRAAEALTIKAIPDAATARWVLELSGGATSVCSLL